MSRQHMCLNLSQINLSQIGCEGASDHIVRLESKVCDMFGELIYDAYKNTVDDHGESLDDAKKEARYTFDGGYGAVLWDNSFGLIVDDRLISVSLVTFFNDEPLLAFVATKKEFQNRGFAELLVRESINSLCLSGHDLITLVVTKENIPAISLYNKLNFKNEE